MEIKTVVESHSWPGAFDEKVNEALADGWHLVRRDVLPGSDRFYAELVKLDPPAEAEEPDLLDCARAIKAECDSHSSCRDCPLDGICDAEYPARWAIAEEVQNDGE